VACLLGAAIWAIRHIVPWLHAHIAQVIAFGFFALVAAAVGWVVVPLVNDWLEAEQVKEQRRSALKQLGRLHQQTAQAINQTGNGQPSGKPTVRGQIIP
jgi:hypothetical protein